MADVPQVMLRDDNPMPQIGFGVFLVPDPETHEAVTTALDVGYRHVDTAAAYRNEGSVGSALRASGLAREDVFVTSKCWNTDHGYAESQAACRASLERLGIDYLDLYLIHWPTPARDDYVDTWRGLVQIQADGLARSVGVSNFHVPHLRRIIDETGVVPAVNQIELHPWLQQRELRAFHAEHGIVTEAWSPIARGGSHLEDPIVVDIARRHDVTPAQAILRWHLDLGDVVIPKSVHRERMTSNLDILGFALDDADHERLAALDDGTRVGPDPETFNGS